MSLHALDFALFTRAQSLLDEEWLGNDADLAPVLPTVLARNVGQDWHKAGTFRHHLVGVARSLAQWQQPRDIRLLGLLHSVYGNAFVDIVKFDPARERARLQGLVGASAEHLVYLFCTMSRTQFVQKVLAGELEPDGRLVLEKDGQEQVLSPFEVAAFVVVEAVEDVGAAIDQRHVRAQAAEQRGEFAADVAAAHHQQALGEIGQIEHRVRHHGQLAARHVGRGRHAAGGDQDVARGVARVAHADRVAVHQLRPARAPRAALPAR